MKKKRRIFCWIFLAILWVSNTTVYAQGAGNFSAEERNYIQQKESLKVAVADGWQPILWKDSKSDSYKGLAVDLLEQFSIETGIAIEYVEAESYMDAIRMTEKGTADIMAMEVWYEYSQPLYKLKETEPYLESQMMLLHSKNLSLKSLPEYDMAEVHGYPLFSDNKKIFHMVFDKPEDCFVAIRSEHADFMYCDVFTGAVHLMQYENRDLVSLPINAIMQFRFGVSSSEDPALISLLNGFIGNVERKMINDSLTHNQLKPQSSVGNFIYYYSFEVITVILILAFVTILIFVVATRIKSHSSIAAHGYTESYRILADTFGEAGLHYEYIENKLTVFGKNTGNLSMPSEIENFSAYLEREEKEISLTQEQFKQMLRDGMDGNSYSEELECRMSNGEWQHFRFIFSVISTNESYQRPICMIGCLLNVEKEYKEKDELRRLGLYDKVTQLFNRAGAEAEIERCLKDGGRTADDVLLIIDVDHFKSFNDTMGHDCGDDVLVTIGKHLQQVFRKEDILCRWGGDEFLLYLKNAAKGMGLIEQRCMELQGRMKSYRYKDAKIPVTLSIGGAIVGERSLEETFRTADKALYIVKEKGRDAVYIISE